MAKIYGVDASKIKLEVLTEALERTDLPTDGEVGEMVGRMVAYCREKGGELQCDNCGGVSVEEFAACPYCGQVDEDEVSNEEENNEVEEEMPVKTKATKAPKAEPKAEPKAATKAPKAATKAPKAEPKAKKAKGKTKAIVVVDVDPRFSMTDLDAAVERANQLTRAGAVVAFELGLQLQAIHRDQLWKLRSVDGVPKYKSFEQFVMNELEISRTTAYEQIDVSANYQKEDVEKIGYKKLALLLKAPEAARPQLKAKAEKGASFRDLTAEVKEAKLAAGDTGKRVTGRKPMPAGKDGGQKSKDKGGDKITVASLLGKQTVNLFKSLKKSDSKDPVPAESLDDQPWGILELPNGVVEVFNLTVNAQGKLILQIKRERPSKK